VSGLVELLFGDQDECLGGSIWQLSEGEQGSFLPLMFGEGDSDTGRVPSELGLTREETASDDCGHTTRTS
jgi:hypothetical protein